MALIPNVGDILMLSQTAWKIGRAFTQGKKSAPSEFAEVEREANGLSEALKLVADTLHADGSILEAADGETQQAVRSILESAHTTLSDLDSLVDKFSVLDRKTGTRSWSEAVIAHYRTIQWTQTKGSITDLRDMLHLHTNTINLTMQALQSRSLARLERIAVPMAEKVDAIHHTVSGEAGIGKKVDELHALVMMLAGNTPSLVARDYRGRAASGSTISTLETQRSEHMLEPAPRTFDDMQPDVEEHQERRRRLCNERMREDSAYYSLDVSGKSKDWSFERGSPPSNRSSIGGSAAETLVPRIAGTGSYLSTPENEANRRSRSVRRESLTIPRLLATSSSEDTRTGSSAEHLASPDVSPLSRRTSNRKGKRAVIRQESLPPPALDSLHCDPPVLEPATPASIFCQPRSPSSTKAGSRPPTGSESRKRAAEKAVARTSPMLKPRLLSFEKQLFRNAAILCDARYSVVEYAERNHDAVDVRYETEMIPAATEGRICVIRKREHLPHGGTQTATSVWTISDDGEVRCQQKLPEHVESIPFCSYFSPEKVSLPSHTPGQDVILRFHAAQWEDPLIKEVKTNWVNYILESPDAAMCFQGAIFERKLLGCFATLKTTVLHSGLAGAFAFEEQMANIDVLRIWEEDGSNIPGATGGVMAMIHYASNFSYGWARWWMNSSRQHVRLKDDDIKNVKVKGIEITAPNPGAALADRARTITAVGDSMGRRPSELQRRKKDQERKITGIKIEFRDVEERCRFMVLMKRIQERMLPLPDLP